MRAANPARTLEGVSGGVMVPIDALVDAFALTIEDFVARHRGLFFVPAARASATGGGTARSTPSSRRRGDVDETAPHPGHDAASYWLSIPPTPTRLPLVIGRAATSDLTLVHPSVSRRHAALWPDAAFVQIEDLGSQHGTRIGRALLHAGERGVVALAEVVHFADVSLALVDARQYWRAARGDTGR